MKNRIIYTIASIIVVMNAFSQNNSLESAKSADKDYDKYYFVDAIKTYERLFNKGYKSTDMFQKLGNSYYFKADLENAAKWYEELFLFTQDVEPEYYYRYAQSLKSIKNYKKADEMLVVFNERNGNDIRAKLFSNQKNYLDLIKRNSGRYTIKNAGINSVFSDYGSSFYDNKVVFASSRDTSSIGNKKHQWTGESFTDLFAADKGAEGSLSSVVKFSDNLNTLFHESTPVFTKDGKTVYFTRNNFLGKKGFDKDKAILLKIYKATLEGTLWKNIVELPFNSDEYSVAHPVLSADEKTLYFSSDMPGSVGQSDLYKVAINSDGTFGTPENLGNIINTEGRETFPFISASNELYFASDGHSGLGGLDVFVANTEKDGSFKQVTNIGEPLNSSKDDFSFLMDSETKVGYITSNRKGGLGGDDIYIFKELKKLETKCEQQLNGIATDLATNEVLSNAKVTLSDSNFTVLKEVITGSDGKFDFGIVECGTKYNIKTEKSFYTTVETPTITANVSGLTFVPVVVTKSNTTVTIGKNLADKDALDIKQIYFDLDKFNIRTDAEIELAKILDVMEQYPTMEIDIRSHTDSRNSTKYNQLLSDRRAKATSDWLVSKGIDRKRLSAKGYGESQLTNYCSNGFKCSEQEHQINRRSEFIIKKM